MREDSTPIPFNRCIPGYVCTAQVNIKVKSGECEWHPSPSLTNSCPDRCLTAVVIGHGPMLQSAVWIVPYYIACLAEPPFEAGIANNVLSCVSLRHMARSTLKTTDSNTIDTRAFTFHAQHKTESPEAGRVGTFALETLSQARIPTHRRRCGW